MKTKSLLAGIGVALMVLSFAWPSAAQTAYTPNVNNVGLPPTGVFSGGSIDSVQLQNGNLHVDIPLLHLPGIGMDTDIHFVYDNQLFNETQVNWGTSGALQQWQQISIGRNGFAQVSDPLQGVLKVGYHTENWVCGLYSIPTGEWPVISWSGTLTHIDYMAFTDPDGTGHSFPVNGYQIDSMYQQDTCTPGDALYLANSYSADATGYNLILNPNLTVFPNTSNVVSLTDKHGRQYTLTSGGGSGSIGAYIGYNGSAGLPPNPVYSPAILTYQQVIKVEDSDGNIISAGAQPGSQLYTQCQSAYCFTDTAGRTIMESGSSGFGIPMLVGEMGANEPQTIQYLDQNNTLQTITIIYSPYTLDLPSLCGGNSPVCGPAIGTPAMLVVVNLPTSIVLQNNDTYTIQYKTDGDSGCTPLANSLGCTLGEISQITLPTGGVISYMWSELQGIHDGIVGRRVLSRTVTANGQSSTWQYQYPNSAGDSSSVNRTVTDPYLNDTVYTFDFSGGVGNANSGCYGPSPVVTQEVSYNGSQSANSPIATKAIGYTYMGGFMGTGTYLPTSNTLTWNPSGVTTETDTAYDNMLTSANGCGTSADSTTSRGNVVSKTVYDYGTAGSGAHGAMLSNTQYSYLHNQNPAYAAANITDRVSQVSVYNAASALVAQTTTAYDQFGLASTSGTTQHDYTNFNASYMLRGLPTSVTKYTGASSAPITTSAYYNDLGNRVTTIDGRGYSTKYAYGAQNAFLATTTMPPTSNGVAHVITTNYDVNTGLLNWQEDYNGSVTGNMTSYTYDPLMRPLVTTRPDGGTTTNVYPSPNQIVTTVVESPSPNKVTTTNLDGLGRKISVSTATTPIDTACGSLTVNTTYDLLSRVSAVSNPHCNSSQATDGWTQYAYDAIGRLTTKTNPDSSAQSWTFNGNVVNFYDESYNLWTRTYNAESWLTKVLEPPGTTNSGAAPTLETDYAYDTLGNLLRVDQCGGACPSSGDHVRSFTYDAMSRLLAAYNPETGTIIYAYDNNSNLLRKTDNRGISINYSYDQLNRLLGKTYSDSTPPVSFTYDNSSIPGSANDIGELTQATVQTGSTTLATTSTYAYDPMGRLLAEQQCTPANCGSSTYNLSYAYDQGGKPVSATFPSNAPTSSASSGGPVTFAYNYDNAERLVTVGSSWSDSTTHPATLFAPPANPSLPEYGPMGLQNASLGVNSQSGTTTASLQRAYDNRGRIDLEQDGPGNIITTGADSTGSITISGTEGSVTKTNTPGSAVLTVSGSEQLTNSCTTVNTCEPSPSQCTYYVPITTCTQVPATGAVSVTVQGFTATANYGGGSTGATLATALATGFNVSRSPVTATASGSSLTITAKTTGLSSNYTYSTSSSYLPDFVVISTSGTFTGGYIASGTYYGAGTFTGGWNAGTYYDTGAITATVSDLTAQVNWVQGSTPSSLATTLAASINGLEGIPGSSCPTAAQIATATGFVSACASGGTVTLTSLNGGPAVDWSVTATAADTNPEYFSLSGPNNYSGPLSFTATATSMSGGETIGNAVYSYAIPDQGGYAPNGNLLSVADTVTGTWSYTYDNLNRLLTGTSTAGYYAGAQMSWSYDPFGNRKSEVVGGTVAAPMPSSSTASYTAATNQVASVNGGAGLYYDAAGDVTQDLLNSYLYDAEGRLCAAMTAGPSYTGYVYDAAGIRVAKGSLTNFTCDFNPADSAYNHFTPTASYVLGPGGEQVTEYAVSGAASTWQHTNAFSGGKIQATYHDTGTYFYLGDWLGTKRVEVGTNSNGNGIGCATGYTSLAYGDGLTTVALPGYSSCASTPPNTTTPAKNAIPNQVTTTSGLGTTQAQWGVSYRPIGRRRSYLFHMQSSGTRKA